MSNANKIRIEGVDYDLKDPSGRLVKVPLKVGDNLRGKTIFFDTTYLDNIHIEDDSICELLIFNFTDTSANNGVYFTTDGGDGGGYSFVNEDIEIIFRNPNENGYEWLMSSYTFPNDKDYIISNITNINACNTVNNLGIDQQEAYERLAEDSRVITRPLQVGDNLRGKTIIFDTNYVNDGTIHMDLAIIVNNSVQQSFGVEYYDDIYNSKMDFYQGSTQFTNYDTGQWLMYNYTFPNDQDYIINVINMQLPFVKLKMGQQEAYEEQPKMINIEYHELKNLRDNSKLIPGQQYRITDYQCTTTQENTRSADVKFDIIVTADCINTLNENARATFHYGLENLIYDVTLFQDYKFESWELKYCLDNDTTRFAWADDTSNGKGVIYWMKDEWGNECPYDFKNIMFLRESFVDVDHEITFTNKYFYTFSAYDYTDTSNSGLPTIYDATLLNFKDQIDDWTCTCIGNIINVYTEKYVEDRQYQKLNNIVFINSFSIYEATYFECSNNTFGNGCNSITFGNDCNSIIFGIGCYNNTFGNVCSHNTFGSGCSRNIFDNYCYNNTFGNECYNNTFGSGCSSNTFDNYCCNNTFGNNCYYNTFGNGCNSITFSNGCNHNTFGNYCGSNVFGNSCSSNTFGNDCNYNTFGNDCNYNTFGNGCNYNTLLIDYCRYNVIDNYCSFINIVCQDNVVGSSNMLQNIHICQGVSGVALNNKKTITVPDRNLRYQITYKASGSTETEV